MRILKNIDRNRLVDGAMGRIPCDLTVTNVQLVNVITGEIYPASVDVLDGVIVRVRTDNTDAPVAAQVLDGGNAYLVPGFIDAHMHVESTMMTPSSFAEAALPWGTTTVVTDPHEIANVVGIKGVHFMIEDAKRLPLRQYVLAPSCVPAVPKLEDAGASFEAKEVAELMEAEDVLGIAEVMDFVGVCENAPRMAGILQEAIKRDGFVQGHSPGVTGAMLDAYLVAGPQSDHESKGTAECLQKLRSGMHIDLRASSIVNELPLLVKGFENHRWKDNVSLCTDDVHAADLLEEGHLNRVMKMAITSGVEPIDAIRFATWNAAREYGFTDLGAIAPGFVADFQLLDALDGSRPNAVFMSGKLVAKDGVCIAQRLEKAIPQEYMDTIHLRELTEEDFLLHAPKGTGATVKTLVKDMGEHRYGKQTWLELPVHNGIVDVCSQQGMQCLAVFNRYGTGNKTVMPLKNFGVDNGAIASTVSHDSHNLTVVYTNQQDALLACNELKRLGGGVCVVKDGKVLAAVPLPVAGLMSTASCKQVAQEVRQVEKALEQICEIPFPLMRIVSLCLPVIPSISVTDRGVVDCPTQTFLAQFAE